MGLDALDQSICAVLGSDQFQENTPSRPYDKSQEVRNFTSSQLQFGILLNIGMGIGYH